MRQCRQLSRVQVPACRTNGLASEGSMSPGPICQAGKHEERSKKIRVLCSIWFEVCMAGTYMKVQISSLPRCRLS